MATVNLQDFLRRLTRGMAAHTLRDYSDQQLVERALGERDEFAFQAIVHRHGSMVFSVCWRVLQHAQDAEDAFQATFLILAQKLHTLRKQASLASWLHGVAHRVALNAKTQSAARRCREQQVSRPDMFPCDDVTWGELRSVLDVELGQLPDQWRLPLILCYLEGRTQDESASQLGWSRQTFRRRLEAARAALRGRLSGRGLELPAALSAVLLADCSASASPALGVVASTVEAALSVFSGQALTACGLSARVVALAKGEMVMSAKKMLLVLVLAFLTGTVAISAGTWAETSRVDAPVIAATGTLIPNEPPLALRHMLTNVSQQPTPPELPKQVPNIVLFSPDGKKTFDLHKLSEKGPLLVRLTCACVGCDGEIHFFQKLQEAYNDKGLQTIAVFREKPEAIESYAVKKKISFMWLSDPKGELWKAFDAKTMPTNVLIEKGGKVNRQVCGCTLDGKNAQLLSDEIARMLGTTPVTIAEPNAKKN